MSECKKREKNSQVEATLEKFLDTKQISEFHRGWNQLKDHFWDFVINSWIRQNIKVKFK